MNSETDPDDVEPNFGKTSSLVPISYGEDRIPQVVDALINWEVKQQGLGVSNEATLFGGVKHPAYSDEKEVRLIVSPQGCIEAPAQLRQGWHHLVPYLEYSFVEEAIISIKVGPGPHQARNLNALKLYLNPDGRGPVHYYDEITASSVPYIP